MEIEFIETEADFRWALSEVSRHFASRTAAADDCRIEALCEMITAYENQSHPMEAASRGL